MVSEVRAPFGGKAWIGSTTHGNQEEELKRHRHTPGTDVQYRDACTTRQPATIKGCCTKPNPLRFRNKDLGHMSERKSLSRNDVSSTRPRRRIDKQKYKGEGAKQKNHFKDKGGGKGSMLNPHFCFCPLRVALAPFA
ncbi:hypothetical protein SEVIR_9G462550v4 [Setaria viridis]